MRILLWHGYLLRGSGSNVYTSNIARAWRSQGHDVLVICQEKDASGLDYVDEIGTFDTDDSGFTTEATGVDPGPGRCRVVAPYIAGLLPVYVYDDYEGFTVKTFVDLTDAELERYTRLNVDALEAAISAFEPQVFITGHEVMGPFIAAEAVRSTGTPFLAKLHGSALEYAVKQQERYRHFASVGLSAASCVVGGSEYMVGEAARYIPGWEDRARVVNPGCDADLFRPQPRLSSAPPTIGFVGKLIAAKGVHDLLASLPLVEADDLHAVVVGYGGFGSELHDLLEALLGGRTDEARRIASSGEDGRPLAALTSFLDTDAGEPYFERARTLHVDLPGRLEHGPLSKVLPTFDVLAVPSVVPEAFGMVAAEAAACGVLPVVPDHSGIGEVGRILERELDRPGLLVFDHTDPIRSLASRLSAVLRLPAKEREELGLKAVELARTRWSWTHVADRLRELASG